jgi:hypothetical protein
MGKAACPQEAHRAIQSPSSARVGVDAVWRVVNGIEYVRTESGYYVRADGTGPLLLEPPTEGSPQ